MSTFDVWAPYARDIRLVVDGETHPLTPDGDRRGWWVSGVEKKDGQRYGFQLFDGNTWSDTIPDPRSRRQPDGVHGLSQVYEDHFQWSDEEWTGRALPGSVIYELHVGTFFPEGTFAGVEKHLDYLKELGITTIELMPVQPFSGTRNWGYDGVDWHCVHESYGGPDGLKRLINACHNKGLSVLLDVVYNHFGPVGNYTSMFGPYTTTGMTDWGNVVNYIGNGSDEVRRYVIDAARQWLTEFHADGLRLDAVQTIFDDGALHLLEELAILKAEVEAETGIPKTLIAESDQNDPKLVAPRGASGLGGFGLDAQWGDDLHHALHSLTSGETHTYYADFNSVNALAQTLNHVFYHNGTYSTFRGRTHGRPVDTSATPAFRFLAYTTTHDQTGNRPRGDRPSQYLTPEQQVLKAAVVLCSPFTPMLFMGEEFGATTPFPFFCSHDSEELNRLTREGRQRQFDYQGFGSQEMPDPAAPATFESAVLDWNLTDTQKDILTAYMRLLSLRKEYRLQRPWLNKMRIAHHSDEDGRGWIIFGYDDIALLANLSAHEVTCEFGGELIYSFSEPTVTETSSTLPAWGFALLKNPRWS